MSGFLAWIIISILVGYLSSEKTIGFWGGFLWSIFLSPFVGLFICVFSKHKVENESKNEYVYISDKKNDDSNKTININTELIKNTNNMQNATITLNFESIFGPHGYVSSSLIVDNYGRAHLQLYTSDNNSKRSGLIAKLNADDFF